MKNRRLEDVFDDKLIDILRKYGLAGFLPASAAADIGAQQSDGL